MDIPEILQISDELDHLARQLRCESCLVFTLHNAMLYDGMECGSYADGVYGLSCHLDGLAEQFSALGRRLAALSCDEQANRL